MPVTLDILAAPYLADLHPEFSSWLKHVAAPPAVPTEAALLDAYFPPLNAVAALSHATTAPLYTDAWVSLPVATPIGVPKAVTSGQGMEDSVHRVDVDEAARLASLDEECLRAACDTTVCPSLLLLLQACCAACSEDGSVSGGAGGSADGSVSGGAGGGASGTGWECSNVGTHMLW